MFAIRNIRINYKLIIITLIVQIIEYFPSVRIVQH